MLLDRKYPERLLNSAIDKARKIPRLVALIKVKKKSKTTNRPVLALTFDPRLPPIASIQAKHWRAMTLQNQYLSEVFPNPPLTAFKR